MKTRKRIAGATATLLACLLAAGCDRAPDRTDGAGATTDRTLIGRQAAKAIDKAGEKLRTENIRLGMDNLVTINGRSFGTKRSADDRPVAELTPDGTLLIAGKAVPATPAQHALLLEHRRQLEGLALAGMAIGAQGADIAGTALTGIGQALFGGKEGRDSYEARIKAEAAKIEAEAERLCTLLPPLYESQQALAAALPDFAPYATLTRGDVEDCGHRAEGGSGEDSGGSSDT